MSLSSHNLSLYTWALIQEPQASFSRYCLFLIFRNDNLNFCHQQHESKFYDCFVILLLYFFGLFSCWVYHIGQYFIFIKVPGVFLYYYFSCYPEPFKISSQNFLFYFCFCNHFKILYFQKQELRKVVDIYSIYNRYYPNIAHGGLFINYVLGNTFWKFISI